MLRTLRSALVTLLLPGLSLASGDGALALAFSLQHERVELASITHLPSEPLEFRTKARAWSVAAEDVHGNLAWTRSLPAPTRFHAAPADAIDFIAVVPRVAAGTRLSLRDHRQRECWSRVIDDALLRAANELGDRQRVRVARAKAATAQIDRRPPHPALLKQRAVVAKARPIAHPKPVASTPVRASELRHARLANPMARSGEDRRSPARSAHSVEFDRIDLRSAAAASKATTLVAIVVVDDRGAAPGQAFDGDLFRNGQRLSTFQVGAQGNATLPLENGITYGLELRPDPPLMTRRLTITYAGQALPPVVLMRGWTLELQLQDHAGEALDVAYGATITGSDGSGSRTFLPSATSTPGRMRFALPRSPAWKHRLSATSLGGDYASFDLAIGSLQGDETIAVRLLRSITTAGRVRASDGLPLPDGGSVSCQHTAVGRAPAYRGGADAGTDGVFAIALPPGPVFDCYLWYPPPMIERSVSQVFLPGQPFEASLLRGGSVRFVLQDQDGQPVEGNVSAHWFDPATQSGGDCYSAPCDLLLPAELAVAVEFRLQDWHYPAFLHLDPTQYLPGSERRVVVARKRKVTGAVRNASELAEFGTRIRVYDANDDFVVSTIGTPFELHLPEGEYRFEADPNAHALPADGPWLFQRPVSSGWVTVDRDQALPDLVLSQERGEVELLVDRPCGFDDRAVHLALTMPDGRQVETMHHQPDSVSALPRPPGQCASAHTLGLSPGDYVIDVAPLGWSPQRVEVTVEAAAKPQLQSLVFSVADRDAIWRGTLVDAQQLPVSTDLWVLDANEQLVFSTRTDAHGRFELPFHPGWGVAVQLFGEELSDNLGDLFRYGAALPPATWSLGRIDLTRTPDAGLVRLYGDGDRARSLNILFVAEGYTDVSETFTDLNHNGVWDGANWYDLNGNGSFDVAFDRVATFGSTSFPVDGSVPTANNEPFVDLNGDSVLSLDDPALFIANAETFLRALLGADVWREHRDALNAYLLFAPSNQAGHDVVDLQETVRIERDTLYDSRLQARDQILGVDANDLLAQALIALPQVDLVVAMVNEPIPGGRANAFGGEPGLIIYSGGLHSIHATSPGPSHEMGHFVAGLCDEYSVNGGLHPLQRNGDIGLNCANATFEVQRERLPWRGLLTETAGPFPTRDRNGSTGLFEGASYFHDGVYRPSLQSTMRTGVFFNAPSRLALQSALDARAAAKLSIFESGFE